MRTDYNTTTGDPCCSSDCDCFEQNMDTTNDVVAY